MKLAVPFQVSGSLQSPDVTVDTGGTLLKAAKTTGTIASFVIPLVGLGVVAGRTAIKDRQGCETAYTIQRGEASGAEPDSAAAAQAEPVAQQKTAATSSSEAAPLPGSVTLSGGRVGTSVLNKALAKLGFTNIGKVQRTGSIVRVDADWQGDLVKLRIDTRTGRIEPIE